MVTRIALVGLGGYGGGYLQQLLHPPTDRDVQLVAGIDPVPERCQHLADLDQAGIPILPSLQDFLAQDHADLVILASPIHMHATQTCLSLAYGSHVLCEKPVCAVIQDAHQMAEAQARADKFVAIGYQWSFSPAIQALKQDILSGVLGKPKRLKTRVLWPRPASYYHRNQWAGRIKTEAGDWVLDSPANNATAHYLHNMLYVLGGTTSSSARPISVQAELYRANPIENYDAAALRVMTDDQVEILFYTAHTVPETINPTFSFEFENAIVTYVAYSGNGIIARFSNGQTKDYGDPNAPGNDFMKLWQSVDSINTSQPVKCGIEAAAAHTLCINGAQESSEITPVPTQDVRQDPLGESDTLTWVQGLQEALLLGYDLDCLPGETNTLPWSKVGKEVNLIEYQSYPNEARE